MLESMMDAEKYGIILVFTVPLEERRHYESLINTQIIEFYFTRRVSSKTTAMMMSLNNCPANIFNIQHLRCQESVFDIFERIP